MKYILDFEVRDYECDLQGIVNNANYLHYLEHTRHKFLREIGVSFSDLHDQGIDLVVARYTLEYKASLRSGDTFRSELTMSKDGLKYAFHQRIIRESDGKLCMRAKVDSVCVVNGKLSDYAPLQEAVKDYLI